MQFLKPMLRDVRRTLESAPEQVPDLPSIDLLSLDVEGYELNVHEGMYLARFSPRHELVDRLSHHDCLYRRRDTAPAPAA